MDLKLDVNRRYTYADYLTWFDDVRRELIDGFIKLMSPAPSRKHQKISINLSTALNVYLKKKNCEVYSAPFDVRLTKNGETEGKHIYTVVQPDICIICDTKKLDDKGCLGSPDLIVEILSKNSKHDVKTKYRLYEEHGVKEYWLVYPYECTVHVFLLDKDGKYHNAGIYAEDEKVKVNIFDDLYIDLTEIFE